MSDMKIYRCDSCGKRRSKDEGGTVFTLCDKCWEKAYKTVAPTHTRRRLWCAKDNKSGRLLHETLSTTKSGAANYIHAHLRGGYSFVPVQIEEMTK